MLAILWPSRNRYRLADVRHIDSFRFDLAGVLDDPNQCVHLVVFADQFEFRFVEHLLGEVDRIVAGVGILKYLMIKIIAISAIPIFFLYL
ncbi:hypothetical protein [Nitrosomonas nitrosa]|uniref:hypothetical protein n=1 Tax=Nitrosomonas nitrosa TaxID=52442 RepID=UPI000D30F2C3|nr:hypothetical protein [Nitrosomonas nitrosa]MCO6432903.1 hypothetical protein [Nitrosomonas nitrosa]